MHLKEEVDVEAALLAGRNGKVGTLAVVEMPEPENSQSNVQGVLEDQRFNVMVVEQVDINMATGGTGIFAEEICQRIKDALHLWADDQYGTIKVAGKTTFVRDSGFDGCMVYRIPFILPKAKSYQSARCGTVTITNNSGTVTMSCPTAGAAIFYTLNGTSPCNPNGGNADSQLYSFPFPVATGTLVRAAAFAQNMNQSEQRSLQL